jgi:hypothetical protein
LDIITAIFSIGYSFISIFSFPGKPDHVVYYIALLNQDRREQDLLSIAENKKTGINVPYTCRSYPGYYRKPHSLSDWKTL